MSTTRTFDCYKDGLLHFTDGSQWKPSKGIDEDSAKLLVHGEAVRFEPSLAGPPPCSTLYGQHVDHLDAIQVSPKP